MRSRHVAALGLLAAGLASAAFAVGASARPAAPVTAKVDPQVAYGAHLFNQFACSACHGVQGKGGVSPYVPDLKPIAHALTYTVVRTIVDHGLGVVDNPKRPYMPVWGPVISEYQVRALVAYIRAGFPAVQYATPVPVPKDQGAVVAGAALYEKYGCINCHGPNGLGGVPNPQSPDKTIPPLSGADFFKQFDTDKKITDFIRSGSVLGRQPIVSMPHWGGIISDPDLQALAAYIKTLKTA